MFERSCVRLAVVGVLLAPYGLVMAQQLSSADLVKGNYGKFATVLKLADLPDDYSAVKLVMSPSSNDTMMSLLPLVGMGGRNDPASLMKVRLAQCCWSNGDSVRFMGRDYLVTYRVDVDASAVFAQESRYSFGTTEPPEAEHEPSLKINLVALDSIQGVTPYPELTKKDLLAAFGRGRHGVNSPQDEPRAQATTASNVKQAALGLIMYAGDYDDVLPYVQDTKAVQFLIQPYTKNMQIWETLNPKGGMIRFNMGVAGAEMVSIERPAETVMLFESEPWSDGRRAVAFCDGHVKLVGADEWASLASKLKPAGIKRAGKPLPANYMTKFYAPARRGQ